MRYMRNDRWRVLPALAAMVVVGRVLWMLASAVVVLFRITGTVIGVWVISHARPSKRIDDLTEPLEIGRCPYCKSTRVYPTMYPLDSETPIWHCKNCAHEFYPLARVRERDRLRDSWKEAGGNDALS